jgi:hypothetical protein
LLSRASLSVPFASLLSRASLSVPFASLLSPASFCVRDPTALPQDASAMKEDSKTLHERGKESITEP